MAAPSLPETLQTSIGTAHVLHRLALGVRCLDAVTRRAVGVPIDIGREVTGRFLAPGAEPCWPCLPLETRGPARGVLRFRPDLPRRPFVLRIADPTRRYVARRFRVTLWDLAAVQRVDHGPGQVLIPAAYRLLQPWLLPGSAYPVPAGGTAIRGRVVRDGQPVRWARVRALGPGDATVGHAHADERGEFLLVIANTGTMPPPAPSSLSVRLRVRALRPPPPGTPPRPFNPDRYHDLVVEDVPRAQAPAPPPPPTPPPPDLESPLIRGEMDPIGYIPSAVDPDPIDVQIGRTLALPADIPFAA